MKKYAIAWFVILVGLVGLVSCTDDSEIRTTQFNACTELAQDKTEVGPDQYLYWNNGDEVEIFGDRGHDTYIAAPRADDGTWAVLTNPAASIGGGPYTAYYPASIARTESTVELPATQVSPDGSLAEFPMTAQSLYTTLQFKNLCGVLRVRLHKAGTNISRIAITMDRPINGHFSCNSSSEAPELAHLDGGSCTTTLLCATPQSIDEERCFYLYVPAGTYSTMELRIYNDEGEMCVKIGHNIIVERSLYTNLNIAQLPFITEGCVPSLFSVGAGRQVRFSQGNLQYQASSGIWRFAEHQYDFVGNAMTGNVYEGGTKSGNNEIGSNYDGWIDLFGWGTSGAYEAPYSTSTDPTNYYPDGDSDNDLDGGTAQGDWGVYNAISNGGGHAGMWRTLSGGVSGEWAYLLDRRTTAAGTASVIGGHADARYAEVRVCGVRGLIVFPDEFEWPVTVAAVPAVFNESSANWNSIDYTAAQWQQLESAGCVFMPTGGNRYGAGYCSSGTIGYYWSTTHCNDYSSYCIGFGVDEVYSTYVYNREYGLSVRLVTDVEL